jgi:uncharacterized lipoprotein YmbA
MNRVGLTGVLLFLCVAGMLLVGCSPLSPQPDPSRFYVLTSVAEDQDVVAADKLEIALGVGPISMAPYLDRATLVTRVGPNQVEFSQIDRWAEPLEAHFTRIQAENLQLLLGTRSIHNHPWFSSTKLDYRVEITVVRFESDRSSSARLLARWSIKDGNGERLESRESTIEQAAGANTRDASVVALSQAAAELSREIASAIRRLHQSI